jgi:hypothetical protein
MKNHLTTEITKNTKTASIEKPWRKPLIILCVLCALCGEISVFAGTNAAVTFNTNTGALSVPSAGAFYAANPPTNINGATAIHAAGGTDALELTSTPGGTVIQRWYMPMASGFLYEIGEMDTNGLWMSSPLRGPSFIDSSGNGMTWDGQGTPTFYSNVIAKTFTGNLVGNASSATTASNLSGTISPTNLPTVAFLNVLQNGVTNDGVTDVTANLQKLLSNGGAFFLPKGRYYCQEWWLTNNTMLMGDGATLVYATNAWNTNIFCSCGLNQNISIDGLSFVGGNWSDTTTRSFRYYAGSLPLNFANAPMITYWNPWGMRHGLQIRTDAHNSFKNIDISGFSGIGLLPVSSNGGNAFTFPKATISHISCHTNFFGLFASAELNAYAAGYQTNWITNYVPGALTPEYAMFENMDLSGNAVGMCLSAGNHTMIGSDIDANYFNQLDTYGDNHHHGLVSGTLYNHALYFNIYILEGAGSTEGDRWVDCFFAGYSAPANLGAIYLNGCGGFEFSHCGFDAFAFTNVNTPAGMVNTFAHNAYYGTWASQGFSTDGQLIHYGNHSYSVIGDNDTVFSGGLTATSWVNTNGQAGGVSVTATNLAIFNNLGNLIVGPITVTNQWEPMGVQWMLTNTSATFSFSGMQ